MRRLSILLLVAMTIFTAEVCAKSGETTQKESIYLEDEVDSIPTFGGAHFSEFAVWIKHYISNYTWGNRVREEAYVRCVIEKSGEMSEVEVYNCSTGLASAIKRALARAPQFTPALKGGEAVRYRTLFNLSFRAKYEQVYKTTSDYRDSYYYREPTTFQRINNYVRTGQPRSSIEADPTRYYGVSYHSRTTVSTNTVYRNVSVNSSECECFNSDNVDLYPRTSDDKPFVEYVDWIMEGVYPIIERRESRSRGVTTVNNIRFGLLIDKDGTVYPSSQMLSSRSDIYRAIVNRIGESPKLLPAEKDGKAVRYSSSFQVSLQRAKMWNKLTFAEQTKWSLAEEVVFGTTDVDVLPRYNDRDIDSYLDEVTRRAYHNIPDNIRGGIEDDVSVDIIIDKSGKMVRIEVMEESSEELLQATLDAVKSLTQQWVPAYVYGEAVDCRVGVTISFGDVYSEYVDTGKVGVARYNKPEFKGQDARLFIDWVKSRVKMPNGIKRSDYRAVAFVSFIVESDGSLSDVELIRSNDDHLAAEVERVVKSSPKWYAGVDDKGKARIKIAVPIVFF